MAEYKHPEVLVSTEWVAKNLNAPNTRLVEVDVDTTAYDQGHIPGAVGWNWQTQLQDNIRRDLIDKAALEALLSKSFRSTRDRVRVQFAAPHESGCGTFETCRDVCSSVAIWGKADVAQVTHFGGGVVKCFGCQQSTRAARLSRPAV